MCPLFCEPPSLAFCRCLRRAGRYLPLLLSSAGVVLATIARPATAQLVLLDEAFRNAAADPNWIAGIGNQINGVGSNFPCLTAAPNSAGNPPVNVNPANYPIQQPLAGCTAGTVVDPVGTGVLRLTNSLNDQAGFVFYNQSLPSNNGLIISFDIYQYGGNGADGVSFFLIDGTQTPPTRAGAFGGSLGYAQRIGAPGLQNGYVGIGFDSFGNYSNPTEGRVGGIGFIPGAVAIRGSQATDYRYLTGTPSLPQGLGFPNVTTRSPAIRRRIRITLSPNNQITVEVDFGNGYVTIIPTFDLSTVPGQGALPSRLLFGFAGSTGSSLNINEVQDFRITTVPPDLGITKTTNAPTVAVGQNAVYTLTVRNAASAGPPIGPITVTDTIPTGLNLVSAVGTNWTCSASGQLLSCTYNGLPPAPGAVLPPITVTTLATAAAASNVTNGATVATPGDSNPTNDNAAVTIPVTPAPQLTSRKTATDASGDGIASPGEEVVYTIAIANVGNAISTNTLMADPLPANTTYVPNSTTLNGSPIADRAGAMPFVAGDVVNSPGRPIGQVNPGETATVQFRVRVIDPLPPSVTQVANQATVRNTQNPVPVPTNPTTIPTVNPSPQLRLLKRLTNAFRNGVPLPFAFADITPDANTPNFQAAGLQPVGLVTIPPNTLLQSGDELEYTVYFLSDGGSAAIDTRLCDPIPNGTQYVPNSAQIQAGYPLPAAAVTILSPLAPLGSDSPCPDPTNPNGAVLVNLGDVPSLPNLNTGFVRFRVRIN